MLLKILVVILLYILYSSEISGHQCIKENEELCNLEKCCESSCTYEIQQKFQDKKPTCVCKDGYARNFKEECVLYNECEKECGVNEMLNRDVIDRKLKCLKACQCKVAFYRDNFGICRLCNLSKKDQDRCAKFNMDKCACEICKAKYTLCLGKCHTNTKNCAQYNNHTCECTKCDEDQYLPCKGKCYTNMQNCKSYCDKNCECLKCNKGYLLCNELCRPATDNCLKLEETKCNTCEICDTEYTLCGDKCHFAENCDKFDLNTCNCTKCKDNYTMCNGVCYDSINCKSRDPNNCTCTKCVNNYWVCKGQCIPDADKCKQFDEKKCMCKECKTPYVLNNGKCIIDPCIEYDSKKNCVKCKDGYSLCNNTCKACINKQKLNIKTCVCECPPHVKTNCTGIFDNSTCSCSCLPGQQMCKKTCVDYICLNGKVFNNNTCACECPQGTVECSGKCFNSSVCENGLEFNDIACGCVCPRGKQMCKEICMNTTCQSNQIFNNDTCCCECPKGQTLCNKICVYSDCEKPLIFNHETCSCTCPIKGQILCDKKCVNTSCEKPLVFNNETCCCTCPIKGQILCDKKCVNTSCEKPLVFNNETCCCTCPIKGQILCDKKCVNTSCEKPLVFNNETCCCTCPIKGQTLCSGKCVDHTCRENEHFDLKQCLCVCNENYNKNEKDICVREESSCSRQPYLPYISWLPMSPCGDNEKFIQCAPATEVTCQGIRQISQCPKCLCAEGFIRDSITNYCVRFCPQLGSSCETHEIFKCCPERYCLTNSEQVSELGGKTPHKGAFPEPIFDSDCGYKCVDGYGRNKQNKCVPCHSFVVNDEKHFI